MSRALRKRYFSAAAVSALGLCALAVPLYDIWDDVSDLSWSVLSTVVENSPILLLSLALCGAGYWLFARDVDADYVATVAKWNVGVVVIVGLLYAWVILLQLWAMGSLKPWVLALDGVLFSGVIALGIGVYNAEREQYRADLERREEIHRSLTDDVLDTSNVAMVALDDSLDVVWANRATGTYFGVDPEDAVGRDMCRLVTETIAPSFEHPAAFETHATALYDTDATGNRECHVPATNDGPDVDRWLEHRSHPIETGRYAGGRVEYFTNITEQKRAQRRLAAREQNLRDMYEVISDESLSVDEKIEDIIDTGRDLLDAEYGAVARIDRNADTYSPEVVRSERFDIETVPLSDTWCQRMVAEAETLQFGTPPDGAGERSYGTDVSFERYVGTPIYDGDGFYGSLCFLDPAPGRSFDDWQLTMVELIGNWIGYELQRTQLQEQLRHRVQDQEAKLGSFVDAVDEYAIFRVDSSHRITSWNSGAEETTGYDRDEILGERLDVFFESGDSEESPEALLERAGERGKLAYEGWWRRRDGGTFWADVTITAQTLAADDAEFIVIVRDMTDEREYERTIETERERLEFLNRVLRHNLLNSLNVIQGRIALVDDNDVADIALDEHVGTVRNRVDEMTELIERMRTFTNAIIDGDDHELRPVLLGETIARKTEMLSESDESATIDVDIADDDTVLADPLFGAVIENVVANAIVHNDKDVPAVDIYTSDDTVELAVDESGTVQGRVANGPGTQRVEHPAVTVHIADNGPGIPDEEKSAVLEKGISRLSEPGNGFGLFLVKEMMDTYFGEIHIRDNEPEGTIVDLTFLSGQTETQQDTLDRIPAK